MSVNVRLLLMIAKMENYLSGFKSSCSGGDKPKRFDLKRNLPIKTRIYCDITSSHLNETQKFKLQLQTLIKNQNEHVCAYQSNGFASKM